jgi:hypothetical protein
MALPISRKYGKTVVKLKGGPYAGSTFPLSPCPRWNESQKTLKNESQKTLKFFAKGYLGQYDDTGQWHGILIGFEHEPNDNIVLGWGD